MTAEVAPGCPVDLAFDPLSPAYLDDPFAILAALPLAEAPIFYAPSIGYHALALGDQARRHLVWWRAPHRAVSCTSMWCHTGHEVANGRTADTSETTALVRLWVLGWAAVRGVPPPVAHSDGWRVEVGRPQQKRRHVFPHISQALHALGETIVEPWSYLKACATADELRAALPAHWHVEETYFMRFDGPPPAAPELPSGYGLDVATQGRLAVARVLAADGSVAATGHVAVVEDVAIFDRIATDVAHRRRGLGRAVMCALDAASRTLGACCPAVLMRGDAAGWVMAIAVPPDGGHRR